MPPDLLAELAQIDGIEAVKQANADELQLIDGLAVLAGNDDIYARDAGHRRRRRHLRRLARRRAARCGACTTSRTRARRSTPSLRDVYAAMFFTASPAPVKAALNMLGHDVGGAAAAAGRGRRDGARGGPRRCSSATACSAGRHAA